MSNRANAGCPRGGIARVLVAAVLGLCVLLVPGGSAALAASLPDGRAYELVTPLEKNGVEVGTGIPSLEGDAVNWEAPGGCCGASSAAQTLYQSSRTSGGWQTKALTPKPSRPLVGLNEEQNPVFWTGDLSQTIFSTPASYATGDERPSGSGAQDLYLQGPSGSLSWLSQGPFAGSGGAPDTATFDGATPDAEHVVFSSSAQLTPEATGLGELNEPTEYLYERDVAGGATKLLSIVNTTLAAGARGHIATALTAAAVGTTTSGLTAGAGPAVATSLTAGVTAGEATIVVASTAGLAAGEQIAIDTGGAEESATVAAVLDETELLLSAGLVNSHASGAAVAHAGDSSIAVASTEGFAAGQSITVGEEATSIAAVTDGTHLALSAVLTSPQPEGTAVAHAGDSSLAVASTAGFAAGDALVVEAGGERQETVSVVAVADGTHLTLSAPLASSHAAGAQVGYEGDTSVTVASTKGFYGGQEITIDSGASLETASVAAVSDETHLALGAGLTRDHAAGAQVTGPVSAGGAVLGNGSYVGHPFLPANTTGTTTNAISSDGSKIFFESPSPGSSPSGPDVPQSHLYMRDESTGTTTTLDDDPASPGAAHYEGASRDGSLVFFTSNEALAGEPADTGDRELELEPSDNELYEFNTTGHQIGPAPPMSAVPVSAGSIEATASLAAEAHGVVTTELAGHHLEIVAKEGDTTLTVVSTAGFFAGETIEAVDFDNAVCNLRAPGKLTIAAVTDATHLLLTAPLGEVCDEGTEPVSFRGDTTLTLATTAGIVPGEALEIEGERLTVGSVLDATHVTLDNPTTTSHPAGAAVVPSKNQDGSVIGVTAISNDGSHVYFIAEAILAANANSQGQRAVLHKPNLYVFDTASGQTTFIATVAAPDINNCLPNCTQENPYRDARQNVLSHQGSKDGLVAEPDVDRPATPTPNGSVLVFDSSGNLTGQDPGPASTLSAAVETGDRTIAVASTAGFLAGRTVAIGSGVGEELDVIESVPDATHLQLTEIDPAGLEGLVSKHPAGVAVTQLHSELYRYDANDESLACVSCVPAGVTPTGSATLGDAGGGSYGPAGTGVPMNESGSEIFFQTPDPLVSGDVNGGSFANGPFGSTAESSDVYEWENGKVSLISDGRSTAGATLDGTTPSGNDVFLTTLAPLVGSDSDGFSDIYDARVGGGLAEPAAGPAPCSGQNCRPRGASVFFSVPASATLTGKGNVTPLSVSAPSFSVAAITASEKARAVKSGSLALSVSATAGGKLSAGAFAAVGGKSQKVASASVSLGGAGKATLSLRLSTAARRALAKKGKLALRIEVSYSESGTVKVATLTLKRAPAKARQRGKGA